MKTFSLILPGLLFGVCAESASATVVTVNVQAHVIQWVDTAGIFGGQITVGQAITASYTYDSNSIPGMVVQNGFSEYLASAPPAALSVSAGAFTFQSGTGVAIRDSRQTYRLTATLAITLFYRSASHFVWQGVIACGTDSPQALHWLAKSRSRFIW